MNRFWVSIVVFAVACAVIGCSKKTSTTEIDPALLDPCGEAMMQQAIDGWREVEQWSSKDGWMTEMEKTAGNSESDIAQSRETRARQLIEEMFPNCPNRYEYMLFKMLEKTDPR